MDATAGKDVLDLAVVETTKGSAVDALRAALGVDAVLFAGDDVTDETAFRCSATATSGSRSATATPRPGTGSRTHRKVAAVLQRLAALRTGA